MHFENSVIIRRSAHDVFSFLSNREPPSEITRALRPQDIGWPLLSVSNSRTNIISRKDLQRHLRALVTDHLADSIHVPFPEVASMPLGG